MILKEFFVTCMVFTFAIIGFMPHALGNVDSLNSGFYLKNDVHTNILEIGKEVDVVFFLVDNSDDPYVNNLAGMVGYAIHLSNGTDMMIHPPRNEQPIDQAMMEYNKRMENLYVNFQETSTMKDFQIFSFKPEELPQSIKFPFTPQTNGKYFMILYHDFGSSPYTYNKGAFGSFLVVEKFSKAVDEDGECKKKEFRRIIKHDYSSVVCVSPSSISALKARGWALN